MLPGFNHNIRHKGFLVHVQTEDKGVRNPIVMTQLFVDGNVLATRRSTYEKFVMKAAVKEIVQAMMQEQHKTMMKDLIHGRIKAAVDYIHRNHPEATKVTTPEVSNVEPIKTLEKADIENENTDKTLDELILDFLSSNSKDSP